jgi:hypothetical protein
METRTSRINVELRTIDQTIRYASWTAARHPARIMLSVGKTKLEELIGELNGSLSVYRKPYW